VDGVLEIQQYLNVCLLKEGNKLAIAKKGSLARFRMWLDTLQQCFIWRAKSLCD
jgi:hypothetical protein